jgi:Tol biopolymer transport system component
LYLRSLAEPETKIIRGTEGFFNITGPAFSPDGRFIAFHTGSDQTLKRIPVTGGAPLTICRAWEPTSVTWNPEGILYTEASEALSRLPAGSARAEVRFYHSIRIVQPDGGPPRTLVNVEKDQVVFRPQLLPGGRYLLYTLASATGANLWDNARIVAQDLQTGKRVTVREGGSDGRYSPTGHLLYAVSGSLFAVPFDVRSLKTAGSVVPLLAGVMRSELGGAAHYAFADNGTLVYLPGPVSPRWDLAIADRSGQIAPLQLPSRPYESPRASPDGNRIALHSMESDQWAIYVYDLSRRSALRRLTYEGNNRMPVWTSLGERMAFQSDREGDHAIFWQRADGNGAAERLTKPEKDETHEPEAWSEAHQTLLFTVRKGPTLSLWMFSLRTRKAMPFGNVQSLALTGAAFSPDSKWVAYAATEGERRATIYVQPFPPTGIRHELLREGEEPANHPAWAPDGKELYFNPGPGQFKAVKVTTKPNFAFGAVASLPRPFRVSPTRKPRAYDVLPDGKFIAVISPSQSGSESLGPPQVNVVLSWFGDLRARVPDAR